MLSHLLSADLVLLSGSYTIILSHFSHDQFFLTVQIQHFLTLFSTFVTPYSVWASHLVMLSAMFLFC